MKLNLDTLTSLQILSFCSLLLNSLLIFINKNGKIASKFFLILSILSLSFEILDELLIATTNYEYSFPYSSTLTIISLLFFINSIIDIKFKRIYILLYIPVIIDSDIIILNDLSITIYIYFQYVYYTFIILIMINNLYFYLRKKSNRFKEKNENLIDVLYKIMFTIISFSFFLVFTNIIINVYPYLEFYVSAIYIIFTFLLSFFVLYQTVFLKCTFEFVAVNDASISKEIPKKNNSRKTTIDIRNDLEKEQFEIIKKTIVEQKLFKNKDLSLLELSKLFNIHQKEISRLINCYSEGNFYTLVNYLRIEEFKKNIIDEANSNLSILGVAEESGFKSKSSFYEFFKKKEGITPKEYLEKWTSKNSE